MAKSDRKITIESYKKKLQIVREYNKEHYKPMTLRWDYVKDRDIIEHLEKLDSNKKYIAMLIREDMQKHEKAITEECN